MATIQMVGNEVILEFCLVAIEPIVCTVQINALGAIPDPTH